MMLKDSLDLLRHQSNKLKMDNLKQDLLNSEDFNQRHMGGLVTPYNSYSSSTTTTSTLINFLRNKNYFNLRANLEFTTTKPALLTSSSSSMLPVSELLDGLSSVLEKLFGKKIWIYSFLTLFILTLIFTVLFTCICAYCFCCSNCGRRFFCCFRCSNGGQTKKKYDSKKANQKEDSKCCI